jgi:HTH-type transcriptional regulator/antitoxin HigA
MTTLNIDSYRALLVASLPKIIESDEENEVRLQELEALSFAENLTPEDEAYLNLLAFLIEKYEERYKLPRSVSPIEALQILLNNRGLKQTDLVPVIGSKGIVSEIMNGKRELSKSHISKLSEFFRVSPEVFFPAPARG